MPHFTTSTLVLAAALMAATAANAQDNTPAEPQAEAQSASEATEGGLQAGAARVEITPTADSAYPAIGGFEQEKLYLRAIVVDNGETKAVLIGADLGGINEDVWAEASQQIADELAIPVANIIMTRPTPTATSPPTPPRRRVPHGLAATSWPTARWRPCRRRWGEWSPLELASRRARWT